MSLHGPYENDNIFAKILRGEMPCVKVFEDNNILSFMDVFPQSEGHTLVIPKAPSRNFLETNPKDCLLYTSPSPRDGLLSRMPSSA